MIVKRVKACFSLWKNTFLHKQQRRNTSSLHGRQKWCLKERIRARPTRPLQKVIWESGPNETHPCVIPPHLSVFVLPDSWRENTHNILKCQSLFPHSFHFLFSSYISILPLLQLFFSVHFTPHLWSTSEFIGQLFDKTTTSPSYLIPSQWVSGKRVTCCCSVPRTITACGLLGW